MQLNLPKNQLKISKSTTNIAPKLTNSTNFQILSFKKTEPISAVQPDQLTDQYFDEILNKVQNSNQPIISLFKSLNDEGRRSLEKYCISQFDNLPLFLLYELGWELGLQQLSNLCIQELINQNYQQLNYSKYDLMKCSFYSFRRILDQYYSFVKSLEIQGLKPADLKSIIDDFCMMSNVEKKQKQNLYNQYIYAKQNNLLKPTPKSQVRRSMIQSTKNKIQCLTPLKSKNTLNLSRTPVLELQDFQEKPGVKKMSLGQCRKMSLTQSVNLMRAIAQEQISKQQQLYEDIMSVRKSAQSTSSENYLQESFQKLQKLLQNMQKQLQSQQQKIRRIQKSASDIKSGARTKKIDFVFSF